MTVQKTKTKVFVVDLLKETVREVEINKVEKFGMQFTTKNAALSYLLKKLLEQYLTTFINPNINKQLDKLQYIINDIRSQI
jgi:hypothetical protein